MGRASNGTVTVPRDFTIDDANNETFTGSKLMEDFNDLANVATNSLDIQGSTTMQANLDFGNFRGVNLAPAEEISDAVSLVDLLGYINGIVAVDNGSDSGNGIIKLRLNVGGFSTIPVGFKIIFVAPFTMSASAIKNAERYELIQLLIDGGTVQYPVRRAEFTPTPALIYPDDYKDNRGSFIAGRTYTLQFTGTDWDTIDFNPTGTLIPFNDNNYTPVGYLDVAYNYGIDDFNKFAYPRIYDPRLDTPAVGETPAWVNPNKFGMSQLGSIPDHNHLSSASSSGTTGGGGSAALDQLNGVSGLVNPASVDLLKVTIGEEVFPSNISIRYLQRI